MLGSGPILAARRCCGAGWLCNWLSLKLLASTCSSTCILHSLACFRDGVNQDYTCTNEMPISWSDVLYSYTTDLVASRPPKH